MIRDDEFDGTTYINHGHQLPADDSDDSSTESSTDSIAESNATETEAKTEHTEPVELASLEERVEKLEAELSKYEATTDKKLKTVEKLAKKNHVSPEERYYRIQEDS